MNILYTENLKVYFRQKKKVVKALEGIDIFLKEGLTTSLAGESGCGKTTLAKAILKFCKLKEGKIYFKDKDITLKENEPLIRKNIQIVFQNPFLSLDPRYTVFSTLYETVKVFEKINKKEAGEKIMEILKEVGLDRNVLFRYPHQLSGGQCQRVAIARAIINKPSLIILDEPTSNLDISVASRIIALLKNLQRTHQITFLFISHNLKLLRKISHFCFIMYGGKLVEYGPTELIYNNPLHPYTKTLLEASQYRLKSIPSAEATFPEPSAACPFIERCSWRKEKCRWVCEEREAEAHHVVLCNMY